MKLLDVEGLDVCYGDFQALFGVGLRVERGRALALVGANGAGKTTLLRTIAGAIQPSAGLVRYAGDDITSAPPHERIRRGIAMVPEGRRLFPSLTVEENIQVGAAAAASNEWPLDRVYELFPMIAEAPEAPRVHLVGRRAAGGGHRACPGRRAELPAP